MGNWIQGEELRMVKDVLWPGGNLYGMIRDFQAVTSLFRSQTQAGLIPDKLQDFCVSKVSCSERITSDHDGTIKKKIISYW